jgi:single-stranded DNA-binding protein
MPNRFLLEFEGHLGKDPIFKDTANGKPSCYFSVAVTKKGKEKTDDKTAWLNVTAYGYAVEQCHSLKKGSPVLVRVEDPTALRAYKSEGSDGQEYINISVSTFVVLPILWTKKPDMGQPNSADNEARPMGDGMPF